MRLALAMPHCWHHLAASWWIARSHNAQAVVNFAVASTWVLARKSHLEPTLIRCVDELDLGETDLVRKLMNGEIDAWL